MNAITRIDTFINTLREATCAIIAHNHTTETETHND